MLVKWSWVTFTATVTPLCLTLACVETSLNFSVKSFILCHSGIELKIIPTLFGLFGFRLLFILSYIKYNFWAQKKRGIQLLSILRVEALALPIIVEQTTSEATPYEDSHTTRNQNLRKMLHPYGYNTPLIGTCRLRKITPGTSTVAKFKTIISNLQDYDTS